MWMGEAAVTQANGLVKTRLLQSPEAEAQEPTNHKAQNRKL